MSDTINRICAHCETDFDGLPTGEPMLCDDCQEKQDEIQEDTTSMEEKLSKLETL